MTLAVGTQLGPYEILAPIGAGGMGEVYKATDTRLERTVAIKVLPDHLSSSEARQRFEREAKTISQLSHPHICALYDVGREGETEYLVMEYLEGDTLSDRATKGALPLEQTLRYGVEIADALDKAHRQGIVHRDLKPGNVMITKSGVKLLDFGLAKAIAPATPQSSLTGLPTRQGLTQEGTILGTFQYMAPEQLEGKEADARTDIFAFGCVLYEMATGKKSFSGASQASLISAIMSSEPAPISTVQPRSPPAFDRIVKTCLAKDPDDRWQSAGDLGKELRWIAEGSQAGSAVVAPTRRTTRRKAIAGGAAGLLLFVTLFMASDLLRLRGIHPHPIHSFLLPPDGTVFRLTGDDGGPIVLSPDGERVTFAAGGKLWVHSLHSGAALAVPGTELGKAPFWSPDSRSIGFFSEGKLKVVEASGGSVQTICDARNPRGGTWGRRGVIVFAPDIRSGLFRVPASGGAPNPLTHIDERRHTTHRWPFFLPDGEHVIYLAANHAEPRSEESGIYVASVDGKDQRRLLTAYGSAQYASGWLLTVRDTSLIGQRFDPASLVLSGPPVRVADDVNFDAGVWRGTFTVSENGILASALGQAGAGGQLAWLDDSGHRLSTVGERSVGYGLRLSPDGRRASMITGDPNNDIWIYDLERGVRTRLTRNALVTWSPQWSLDGSQIVYLSQAVRGDFELTTMLANGGEPKVVYRSKERIEPTDWSRDGRYVLVDRGNVGASDVWAIPLEDPSGLFPLIRTSTSGTSTNPAAVLRANGQFSPDGHWVAYTSRETGRPEVYVTAFPHVGGRWQVSARGGSQPRWRRDGQELYFVSSDEALMVAAVEGRGAQFEIKNVKELFHVSMFTGPRLGAHGYDVAPDGKRFLVYTASAGEARVAVVAHWDSELEKR